MAAIWQALHGDLEFTVKRSTASKKDITIETKVVSWNENQPFTVDSMSTLTFTLDDEEALNLVELILAAVAAPKLKTPAKPPIPKKPTMPNLSEAARRAWHYSAHDYDKHALD